MSRTQTVSIVVSMKWSARLAILFAGLASTLAAGIEWRGTIVEKNGATFALYDSATGVSKWVGVKGEFEAYSISRYDANHQDLILAKDGVETHLSPAKEEYSAPASVAATPVPSDLANLSGLPLAEVLALRGDQELAKMLEQHRQAVLVREALARQLVDQERVLREALVRGGRSPSNQAAIDADQELNRLRMEATRSDSAIVQMINSITLKADRDRNVMQTAR